MSPLYSTYASRLVKYHKVEKIIEDSLELLGVECTYCGDIFMPKVPAVRTRLDTLHGRATGENNLYCSENCKKACPTYGQKLYPKGFKPATSREVHPELRKLVLKRDKYTCQICNEKEQELHCHHITGVELNPIESADVDNCITLCKTCHKQVHKLPGCGYYELRRNRCKN
jgi:5-methylcytosine-specific restriction endonuclease McrA